MKKIYLILLLMFCFCFTNLNAQNDAMLCTPTGTESTWNGQIGGYALPSEGTIRVLFVFAQFPDDKHDTTNSTWIKGQAPTNMQGWVDQSWSSNPTQGSMTHYFNEMSFNKLKFIGKTVSVVTPQTRAWYLANSKSRGYIHKEIIQQLDQTWDFAQFDNWDFEGNYNHINRPDGIVDMIFMVWRNIANEFSSDSSKTIYQKLDMGRYGDLGGSQFTVDNGLRTIKTGFWPSGNTPGGSGVTLCDWFIENMFRFSIHEYGHYLQGGNDQHVGFGFWGLLSGWGIKNFIANAFERYRLGWINLNTVQASPNQTIQNATLPDFITSGVAYRLVGNAATSEYFYIENHQKISFWENNQMFLRSPYGNIENGIYILRQDAAGGDNTFMQCLAADGRWNWTVNQRVPNPWGSIPPLLPVFKRLGANRVNGYHDLQFIPWTWGGVNQTANAIHFTENKSGQPVLDVRYSGDGKDAFRLGYSEVWSPFSNPNSQRGDLNKTATPFGFKINSFANNVFSLDIFVGTSLNAPPSKPTGLIVGANSQYQAVLNWTQNIETDMQYSGKYKIFRGEGTNGNEPTNFGLVATINAYNGTTPVTSWTDVDVYVGSGTAQLFYRITALDNSNTESTPSLSDWINWDRALQKQSEKTIVNNYYLNQNYPNPFNPQTSIQYDIKESGFVELKVYDILGKEVAELVNEVKDEGIHKIVFDASNFPSGVYIYSLRVNGFVQNNKMTLLK
ncbi:MAG: T9SS type A sorting domain-containing protein [Saprospiraceae bacterium]|nr:T9SS type A sorting domain-containing protein [Saprospiraceae bacterium]